MITLPDNHFEDCAEETMSITIKQAVWVCAALCALVLVALTPRSAVAQTAFASPAATATTTATTTAGPMKCRWTGAVPVL